MHIPVIETGDTQMGQMFSSKDDAVVWLYTNGWRQNDDGVWLKGKRQADIRLSPANDGVVCVAITGTAVAA